MSVHELVLKEIIEKVRRKMGAPGCETCKIRWAAFMEAMDATIQLGCTPRMREIIAEEKARGHAKTG